MQWGNMQSNVQILLPTCVTSRIRNWYPSPVNAYVGYHQNDDSSRVNAVDNIGNRVNGLFWVRVEREQNNSWTWQLQDEDGNEIDMAEHEDCVVPSVVRS